MTLQTPVSLFILLLLFSCENSASPKENAKNSQDTILAPEPRQDSMINYIMGKFDPDADARFVEIEKDYADRAGMLLRKEVYDAFKKMHAAAEEDGISLTIRSATRNFDYQKGIWERKWKGETPVNGQDLNETLPDPYKRASKILEYSSMPGSSRHHWGTDIDLNSFENEYFESGEGKKIYDWLQENAMQYGFCQVYTEKGAHRPHGYLEEKWHWSYVPLARPLTDYAAKYLQDEDIEGFEGAKTADSLDVVIHYVLGVDPKCR